MFAPDALHGHVTQRKVKLTLEARCAEGGQLLTQRQDLLLDRRRRFLGMVMRSAAVFFQTRGAMLLIAPPPLTNGQRTGRKKPRGRLDAALADRFHQAKAMVVGVLHLAYQIEIANGSGHRAALLPVARRPGHPPPGRPAPSASSD